VDRADKPAPLASQRSPITPEHLRRLAVVYVRQSSPGQVLEHTGSTDAQRDLSKVAIGYGWPDSRIQVIDCDLGRSGTSTSGRTGYLHLLTLIDRDEVGIVLVQDLSRLGRDDPAFFFFLQQATDKGVLVYTNGTLHNPASEDLTATLGLKIAGLFGSFDNQLRVLRMREAKIAKAKRGQAVSSPPIGYIRVPDGNWIKDPDRAVQDEIARVFELYPKLGSLGRVVSYFRQHQLEFPRRSGGHVEWGPIDAALLHSVLRNPAYCGDYVFQRRQTKKRPHGSGVIVKFRPPHESIVTHDHHEAYLPRPAWQRIQEVLAAGRPAFRPLTGKGPALLQGLLRCGIGDCGRWMKTQYWGRDGVARTATYTCTRQDGWGTTTHKVRFPAPYLEHVVVEHVLQTLAAIDTETARAVIEEAKLEHAGLERTQRRRLLDAEEDVQRLRQAYLNLSADRQHARIDLMDQYDAAVKRLDDLKRHVATEAAPALSVTTADVDELVQRTRDVRQLWAAPQRTNRERKELLRTVLSEINLHRADREAADLEIVWKGGFRQPLRAYRARGVAGLVAERTKEGKNTRAIAEEFKAAGIVTASGRPISPELVAHKQGSQGLRLKDERRRAREIIRQGLLKKLRRPEILRQLQDRAPRLGPWDPQRLSDAIRQLRRGTADVDALPRVLPAEREKEKVLNFIEEGLTAGRAWKTLAVALNESGLKPPRGTVFTPVQVRLLYLRARGLKSFRLPARPPAKEADA